MIRKLFVVAALLLAPLSGAVAQDADKARGLNDRAVTLFEQGQYPEALVLFREALLLQPRDETFRHNASRCLIAMGDQLFQQRSFREAARDYHEASGLVPKDPAPVVREAQALLEQGLNRDVVAVLRDAVSRWPELTRGHDLLASAYYRQGEIPRAIEHWKRALALETDADARERIQRALEKAEGDERIEGQLVDDLQAPHFAIKYDGEADRQLGLLVGRVLEDAYSEVGSLLGRYPDGVVAVVIYPGKTFQAATGSHGWVAGLYDGKIRIPAGGLSQAPEHEVRRVLKHEYAHAVLRAVGGPAVPVWLHEGFAQLAEGRAAGDARRYVTADSAPALGQLGEAFVKEKDATRARVLYAAAFDLTNHMFSQGGAPLLADLLDRLGRNEGMSESLRRVYGRDLEELHADWLRTLR